MGQGPVERAVVPDGYEVPAQVLEDIDFRMVGPSRGGRVTTVTGIPDQPYVFYMGSTGGGVWKTENAGVSWTNLSDDAFAVGSIGAVAVAPSDPNVVYVGTGSAAPRGNISVGNGVYRSTDAGRSWTHVGLEAAGLIGRIVVDPGDPDRAFVAVLGQIFGRSPERGVYLTEDGGSTWTAVLQISDATGAVELAMNPANPRELFAAMWQAERKPWTLIDGGSEGGLYRTRDGGESWELVGGGLPEASEENPVGKIGVSIAASDPSRVYAFVTAAEERGGLYRSDDGGDTWTRVNGERRLRARGWYYSYVIADPTDPDTVYVLNAPFFKSVDGGKSFQTVRVPHGDNHDLWINPNDSRIMVEANDGGATVTLDGGANWSSIHNQPTAEFYRLTVDEEFPRRLYGAQQDNSTISVPSWTDSGLSPEAHWWDVAGGESGHIAVTPGRPELTYAGNYIGQIDRQDRDEAGARNVIVYPEMADGGGAAGPHLPLPVERSHRRLPARPGGRVPHLQLRPPDHRRRPLVGDHLARPDRGRSRKGRPAGRAGAARPHRRRGLRNDLRARGVAAGVRRHLGRHRRRAGPPDAGRRRLLDRGHPAGHAGGRHREQPGRPPPITTEGSSSPCSGTARTTSSRTCSAPRTSERPGRASGAAGGFRPAIPCGWSGRIPRTGTSSIWGPSSGSS